MQGWRLFTVATAAAAAAAAAALRLNPPTVYSYRFYIQYVETNFIRSTCGPRAGPLLGVWYRVTGWLK